MKGNSNRTIGAVAETLNLRRTAAKDDDSNEGKKTCDKMNPIHNWKETSPIPDLNINIIGAGAEQTSKRYNEWWIVYKLQTMVNKA